MLPDAFAWASSESFGHTVTGIASFGHTGCSMANLTS